MVLIAIYFTFVETQGVPLEEIATIFDGQEAFSEVMNDLAKHEKQDFGLSTSKYDGGQHVEHREGYHAGSVDGAEIS